MYVTVNIIVKEFDAAQTMACLKSAFVESVSSERAVEESEAFNSGQPLEAESIGYACRPTGEALACFTLLGGGVEGVEVEYVLGFARASNETLPALTEHTLKALERHIKANGGKFRFRAARLQDYSSLGTAVEARPTRWTDRFRAYTAQRDLLNRGAIVAALAGLTAFSADWMAGLLAAIVGCVVSVGLSLAQALLPGRAGIEWRIR